MINRSRWEVPKEVSRAGTHRRNNEADHFISSLLPKRFYSQKKTHNDSDKLKRDQFVNEATSLKGFGWKDLLESVKQNEDPRRVWNWGTQSMLACSICRLTRWIIELFISWGALSCKADERFGRRMRWAWGWIFEGLLLDRIAYRRTRNFVN